MGWKGTEIFNSEEYSTRTVGFSVGHHPDIWNIDLESCEEALAYLGFRGSQGSPSQTASWDSHRGLVI